jgi:hypothetical protein
VRALGRPDPVKSEHRRPDDGRRLQDDDLGARRDGADPRVDPLEERREVVAEDPAAEDDVHIELAHPELADRRARHRRDLVGLPVDDRASHRVAFLRSREHHGRELDEPVVRQAAEVHRLHHLSRPPHAVLTRDEGAERGALATSVLCAKRVPERHGADVHPAAPVARDLADGREPVLASVRR